MGSTPTSPPKPRRWGLATGWLAARQPPLALPDEPFFVAGHLTDGPNSVGVGRKLKGNWPARPALCVVVPTEAARQGRKSLPCYAVVSCRPVLPRPPTAVAQSDTRLRANRPACPLSQVAISSAFAVPRVSVCICLRSRRSLPADCATTQTTPSLEHLFDPDGPSLTTLVA